MSGVLADLIPQQSWMCHIIDLAYMSYEPLWPRGDGDGSFWTNKLRRDVFLKCP